MKGADCYLNGDRWCTLGPRPTRSDKAAFVLALLVLALLGVPAWGQAPGIPIGGGGAPSPFNVTGYGVGAWSAAVNAPGTGYVPGDTYVPTLTGVTAKSILGGAYNVAQFVVASTQVVSATVAAGGSGCTNGTQTVTGTTGTGGGSQYFQASVTVAGNAVTAVLSVTRPGIYQVNPTSLTAEPVTGASCTGAQLNVVMGALYVNVQNPGSYSAVPSNPMTAVTGTGGSGTGLTLNVTFALQAAYVLPPANAANGTPASQASYNYCAGYLCLNANTSGVENTAFGWNTLSLNTTGGFNMAFGTNALGNNTTASGNVAIGRDALRNATTGGTNTVIGDAALVGGAGTLTGTGNVAIGNNTMGTATTTGSANTVIGAVAGEAITTGNFNQVIGWGSGSKLTTGAGNTLIGAVVGTSNLSTGSNNILLGAGSAANCDTAAAGTTGTIYICSLTTTTPWLTGSLVSASMSATFGGTLTIAGIASGAQADVVCTTSAGLLTYQVSATGCAVSSIRFKQDLRAIGDAAALDVITRLEPKSYHYRPETDMGNDVHFGFTAEQVGKIDPDLITYEDDGQPHAVKYNELHAFYAGAFRQIKADNDNLRACMESWKCRLFGWK